jgi:hypothetical protein
MGYIDKSYSDLLALIQSLAGVDSFTTSEQTKILALANRRIYQAYTSSPMWPRYIVGAQARPVNDGLIEFDYDEAAGVRTGSSATRSGSTVTIVCTAAVDFVAGMSVAVSGLTGTVDPNGTYKVTGLSETTVKNDTFTYELDTTNTATETYSGTATVSPVAIPDIADFIRCYDGSPFTSYGAEDYDFYQDPEGARLIGDFSGLSAAYVTFKKEWDGPYEDDATTIPLEFFYYGAHAAYADFLRMDGQIDKAMAEETAAQTYLLMELDKAAHSKNNNLLYSRVTTYVSRQAR